MNGYSRIAGLDVSTSRIGYAAPGGALISVSAHAGASDPIRRLDELEVALWAAIRLHPPTPDLVVIEGYSLNSFGPGRSSTMLRLGEVGAVARLLLWRADIAITEVPPASLKLFATGKGNADKPAMVAAAIAAGARGSVNHDEADAFHARHMGRVAHSLDYAEYDHQRVAISKIVW